MESAEISLRLDAAVALAQGGNNKEAEAVLRDLVASGARQSRACMVLGVLCGDRGDREERRLWLREARRLEEAAGTALSLRLLLNQLVDALEHGEPEQAVAYGTEALTSYPELWEVHLHQAHAFLALEQVEQARHHLDRVKEGLHALEANDPSAMNAWRKLAQAEMRVDRPEAPYPAGWEVDPDLGGHH